MFRNILATVARVEFGRMRLKSGRFLFESVCSGSVRLSWMRILPWRKNRSIVYIYLVYVRFLCVYLSTLTSTSRNSQNFAYDVTRTNRVAADLEAVATHARRRLPSHARSGV